MPPRVELIDEAGAPPSARALYADGDPGPLIAAWAQVPELLDVTLPFVATVLGPSSIALRAKELVILRTSALQQCRYCINTHTEVALDAGLTSLEVSALRGAQPLADVFTDAAELALLAWTDRVALGPGSVPAELADDMRRHWADHEVVELTMLVCATLLLNRFATSLELPTGARSLARLAELGFPGEQMAS